MHRSGILIHVHHLDTAGWENLLLGDPTSDRFGSLTMVAYLLLTAPDAAHINTIIIGSGPSSRDGLSEGEYSRQTMLRHFDRLHDFPRLKPLLRTLTAAQIAELRNKIEHILITPQLIRTSDEIRMSATMFAERNISTVYEVCAASHAPRCIQQQALARVNGLIPASQLWLVAATDMCFADSTPDDTVIFEPAHRGDDPVLNNTYSLPKALKPVIRMPAEAKQELAKMVTGFVANKTT